MKQRITEVFMNCSVVEANEILIVSPVGITELVRGSDRRLIEHVAPLLRQQSVALDLHTIDRIDAAGIATLISLYGIARDAGHQFMVCNVSARVGGILSLVGLEHILVSHDVNQSSHSGPCFGRSAA
jgi:anti-anti-sigma factor